ncbi:hypothetical protein J6590_057888 [Homalodisca vitripennis]|nr:hypothetical protein J6590_057888 [Homalodisca vitripennis]
MLSEVGAKLFKKLPLDLRVENRKPPSKRKLRRLLVQGAYWCNEPTTLLGEHAVMRINQFCYEERISRHSLLAEVIPVLFQPWRLQPRTPPPHYPCVNTSTASDHHHCPPYGTSWQLSTSRTTVPTASRRTSYYFFPLGFALSMIFRIGISSKLRSIVVILSKNSASPTDYVVSSKAY